MSKKMMVITSIVVLVIIIGIVLWFITANNEASGYSYSDENITLGYVPDGLECVFSEKTDEYVSVYFTDQTRYFTVDIDNSNTEISVDTENGSLEEIYINESDAFYIETPNVNSIIWYHNELIYSVSGNMPKETLIKIIENVNR